MRWIRPSPIRRLVRRLRFRLLGRRTEVLPSPVSGLRLHVGAGLVKLDGYENLDGFDNSRRPDFFPTSAERLVRAEVLDQVYPPETVAEIRCHHVFEHISILDVDRTLRAWNRVMKAGGLLWIEVPDFEGCARCILALRDEAAKEIYYRHIFGSQVSEGEFHRNGLSSRRLVTLLRAYGFDVRVAYVCWSRRAPCPPHMVYPAHLPLPDLTVKAIKVGPPSAALDSCPWTPVAYRRLYPNPQLAPPPAVARAERLTEPACSACSSV
jgi:hypothetical protein